MKRTTIWMVIALCLMSNKVDAEEFTWGSCTTYAPMPVLFIHGINSNCKTWDITIPELKKYFNYRLVRLNEPESKEGWISPFKEDRTKGVTYFKDEATNYESPAKLYLEAFDYGGKDSSGSFEAVDSHNDILDEEVKKVLKAYYGDDWEKHKLIIVAGSLGGLVSRYYIQHGGTKTVKRLVMFGVPNFGSTLGVFPRIIAVPSYVPIAGRGYKWVLHTIFSKSRGLLNYFAYGDSPALRDTFPESKFLTTLNSEENVKKEESVEYVCFAGETGVGGVRFGIGNPPTFGDMLSYTNGQMGIDRKGNQVFEPIYAEVITITKPHLAQTTNWQRILQGIDGVPDNRNKPYDTPKIALGTSTFTPGTYSLYYQGPVNNFYITGKIYDYLPGSCTISVEINNPGNYAIKDKPVSALNMNTESQEVGTNTTTPTRFNAKFNFKPNVSLSPGIYTFRLTVTNPGSLTATATTTDGLDWIPFRITEIKTPTLLWQKKFDQNVGSIDMSEDGSYIVVSTNSKSGTSSCVYLLDNAGNILWRYDYNQQDSKELGVGAVIISKDGNYIAVQIDKETEYMDEFMYSLLYFNRNGELLWKKEEVEEGIILSEDGKYILSASNWLGYYAYLFDKDGNEIWRKKNIEAIPLMTSDANYILLRDILFDKKGNVIWKKDFIGNSMSENGNIIAGLCFKEGKEYIYVLDKSGNLLWEYALSGIGIGIDYHVMVSSDGNYLLIRDNIPKNYLFDKAGNLLWEKSYSYPDDLGWFSFTMPQNGEYIVILHCLKDYLWIDFLDRSGSIIGQIKENIPNIEGKYAISLSSNGKYLGIIRSDTKTLYLYDTNSIIE